MTGQKGAEVRVRTPNLLTLWCIMRDQTQELLLCPDLTNPERISVYVFFDDIYHGRLVVQTRPPFKKSIFRFKQKEKRKKRDAQRNPLSGWKSSFLL